jgi:hypothetical protein
LAFCEIEQIGKTDDALLAAPAAADVQAVALQSKANG